MARRVEFAFYQIPVNSWHSLGFSSSATAWQFRFPCFSLFHWEQRTWSFAFFCIFWTQTLHKMWKEPESIVLCLCFFCHRVLLQLSEHQEKNGWIEDCSTGLSLPEHNKALHFLYGGFPTFPQMCKIDASWSLRISTQVIPFKSLKIICQLQIWKIFADTVLGLHNIVQNELQIPM